MANERKILVALYKSTDGRHWKNNDGWLGPAGTECNWHGVQCGSGKHGITVREIDLFENGLTGRIPESVGDLNDLRSLMLAGNRLSGLLPDALIQRFWAGELEFFGDDSLLTNVSEIDFEVARNSLLCASHRYTIRADGSAIAYTEQCRNAIPDDRVTYCEVKKANLYHHEFARLARLLETYGFYALKSEYDRSVTHGGFETTVVTRAGKNYKVENYADAGPYNLWVIQRAIDGVGLNILWEDPTRIDRCPELFRRSPIDHFR